MANLQFLHGSNLSNTTAFTSGTIYLDVAKHELWYDTPSATTGEHIKLFKDTYLSLSGGSLGGHLLPTTTNTYDLGSSSLKWANVYTTKINGYTLGAACAKAVTDSSSASAISTGTNLVTERDVYYGLPTINGAHNYTSSTKIYAPTGAGTAGQILTSSGGTPAWSSVSAVMGDYVKKAGDTMTGALTINDTLSVTGATTLSDTLTVAKAATLEGALSVTGATTLSDTLTVNKAATLKSTLGVTGATTLSNTLTVNKATALKSTLGVTGATTLSSTLAVTSATTLSSTLDVAGITTLDDDLNVDGIITSANTTASTNKSTGALIVAGGAGIGGQLSANTVMVGDKATMKYDTTNNYVYFVFS